MNAIDTNVLVYFVDENEPEKQAKATALVKRLSEKKAETLLLWQVAVEFLSCMRRWENDGRIDRKTILGHLEFLEATFPCVVPPFSVLFQSLEMSSRYSLSHWDSLLLAACHDAGVDTLYSEDLEDGMTYGSVTVVNPFAQG
jgi:predicted nucleic acid-binding protein